MTSLSRADAAWLHMETPNNLMMITGLLMLESTPSQQLLEAVLETRLCRYDRFQMAVVEPTLPGLPRWERQPDFRVRDHLIYEELNSLTREAFLARVSRLMSEPLDRRRPLWELRLFPGVEGGCAVAARLHHVIADGIALIRVLLSLCDEAPEALRPGENTPPTDRAPSLYSSAKKFARKLLHGGHDLLFHPTRAAELARQGARAGRALSHILALPPDTPTAFQGNLQRKKVVALSPSVELSRIKAAGKTLHCTVNDILIAALAGALGRNLRRKQDLPTDTQIRAVVPVDLRGGEVAALGNRFGLVFLNLPVGQTDLKLGLQQIHEEMDALKNSAEAFTTFELLSTVGLLPESLEQRIVEWFGKKATAIVTNLPGPRTPLFLAGSKIESIMYWVPQSAQLGLGLSLMSYAGQIRLGVATDAAIVSDPDQIVTDFMVCLEEIIE